MTRRKSIEAWAVVGANGKVWTQNWTEAEAAHDCDPGERVAHLVEAPPAAVARAERAVVKAAEKAQAGMNTMFELDPSDAVTLISAVARLQKARANK